LTFFFIPCKYIWALKGVLSTSTYSTHQANEFYFLVIRKARKQFPYLRTPRNSIIDVINVMYVLVLLYFE